MAQHYLKRTVDYLKIARSLLRVPTYLLLIMYLSAGVLTGLIAANTKPDVANGLLLIVKAAACAFVIAVWYINGSALNDYADYEIDIINLKGDKDRPLVTGAATRQEMLWTAVLCGAAAWLVATAINWRFGVLLAVLLLLNVSYSLKPLQISRRGGIAPLCLPLGYIVLPVCLGFGLSTNRWHQLATIVIVGLYLQFMGRIILKDYRDVKGDKANGKMTFLLRHGNITVCVVSAVAIATSSLWLVIMGRDYFHTFRYGIVCLGGFGIMMLYQLSQVDTWQQQKPIIAAFGRSMTGITALVIVGLATNIWVVPKLTMVYMTGLLVIVYLWSAQQALQYNVALQAKATK